MPVSLIHQTDLFHPHGDPDDHFDLATVFALGAQGALRLQGIIIDYPPPRRRGDPALGAIAQLSRLTGIVTPVAVGTSRTMKFRDDVSPGNTREDSTAIKFVLETLRHTAEPVAISIVGGATDIAVAGKLEPELFAQKCAAIYLNSGSAMPNPDKPGMLEFNVELNPAGYAALFDLPCPIYWCPCWHMTENHTIGLHGTFWQVPHRAVLHTLRDDARKFFLYMFDQEPSHRWLTYLRRSLDERNWDFFMNQRRNMWSTASLFHAAGLTISRSGKIETLADCPESLFRFTPITVTCTDNGETTWEKASGPENNRFIFEITDVDAYAGAMAAALRALLENL